MNNKKTISEAIEFVNSSFPSVWTREDVITLLNDITEAPSEMDADLISCIANEIKDGVYTKCEDLKNDMSDYIDKDSAEFVIEYNNKLVLDDVDIDGSRLANDICDELEETIVAVINREINRHKS